MFASLGIEYIDGTTCDAMRYDQRINSAGMVLVPIIPQPEFRIAFWKPVVGARKWFLYNKSTARGTP